jgi:flagellar assembly protein FliH
LSSTLIKSYTYNYAEEKEKKGKRVIDSNLAVSERIRELSEMMEAEPEEGFADEFTEGLDAAQVDALLTDQDELAAENAKNEAAQKLIDEANEEAQQIIENANAEAERIIAEANAKAEEIFAEAREKGMAEGSEAGYAEGMEKAAEKEREVEEKSVALDRAYEAKVAELEPKFVDTLTDIYSHVLGIDLTGRSETVLHLLQNTIRNIEGTKNYLVHVSGDDHEFVSEHRDDLAEGLGSSATVEVINDVTLTAGNCFVETDGGIFDCSLGTELELLKKELRVLSYGN